MTIYMFEFGESICTAIEIKEMNAQFCPPYYSRPMSDGLA